MSPIGFLPRQQEVLDFILQWMRAQPGTEWAPTEILRAIEAAGYEMTLRNCNKALSLLVITGVLVRKHEVRGSYRLKVPVKAGLQNC